MAGSIIDQRLKNVFKLTFIIITIFVASIGSLVLLDDPTNIFVRVNVFGIFLLILIITGAVLGYSSKILILPGTGNWKRTKRIGSIAEYLELSKAHKVAYSTIYEDISNAGGFACTILTFWLMVVALSTIPTEDIDPAFWGTSGSIVLIFVLYIIFGLLAYETGFHSTEYRVKGIFTEPQEEAVDYVKALSSVEYLDVKAMMEIGEWKEHVALFDTEWKVMMEGLPDTVYMQLKVDKVYMYPYPYLVGIIINGPKVDERIEQIQVDSRFPAIIEYSNDGDVTVLVARFDIPEKDSDLEHEPYTDDKELRSLGIVLAEQIMELYHTI